MLIDFSAGLSRFRRIIWLTMLRLAWLNTRTRRSPVPRYHTGVFQRLPAWQQRGETRCTPLLTADKRLQLFVPTPSPWGGISSY
jgi:hypothetical protein